MKAIGLLIKKSFQIKTQSILSLFSLGALVACGGDPSDPTTTLDESPTAKNSMAPNFHYRSQLSDFPAEKASAQCLNASGSGLFMAECNDAATYFERHLDGSIRTSDGERCLETDTSYRVSLRECKSSHLQRWRVLESGKVESTGVPGLCVSSSPRTGFFLKSCESSEVSRFQERNKKFYDSYLLNPGLRFKSAQTIFKSSSGAAADYRGSKIHSTDLSEAHRVGAPAGACKNFPINDGTGPLYSQDKSCPSFSHLASYGWSIQQLLLGLAQPSGFAIWNLRGGAGQTQLFHYLNHASDFSATEPSSDSQQTQVTEGCALRQTGLHFGRNDVFSQFRLKPDGSEKKFGDYATVVGTFTASVPYVNPRNNLAGAGSVACPLGDGGATANISADLELVFLNPAGEVVRSDVVSLLIYYAFEWNPTSPSNSGEIFWSDGCTGNSCRIAVKADKIGMPLIGRERQSYTINYKKLFERLNERGLYRPPSGYTVGQGVVRGFGILNSVRGADLQLLVEGVDLAGIP